MDLRVDDSAMKSLVAKSIVDSLTPETREKLIADAVMKSLTVPEETGSYGRKGRSPLQRVFDEAVEQEARKYALQVVAEDTAFREAVQRLFADVAKRIFESETRDNMVGAIADTIVKALTKDRY